MPDELRTKAEAAHDGLPWDWPLDEWLREAHASEAEAAFARAASPQAVLALLDERDGYKRAFEESERDLQDTVRELRATEAERDRLRADLREIQQHARDGHAQTAAARLKTVSLMARNALEGGASES